MNFLPAWSGRAVQHPDFGDDSSRDGRRKFNYAAMMSGKIEPRLRHRGTRIRQYTARRRVLAGCAALALALPSIRASTAAEALYTNASDTDAGPSLAGRLGDIAASIYDQAQSDLIAPSRRAAEQVLADPRTQTIYRHLSEAAHDVVALADPDVVRPVWRRSYEAVSAAAADCAERLRLWVLDPVVAGLKRAAEGAMTPPPAPDAAAPRLAVDVTADPFRQVSTIPGLPDSDIFRNLNGSDPLEPFNRLMLDFRQCEAAAGQFAVDGDGVGKFLLPDLAPLHHLREHDLDVMLGLADQRDIVFGGDAEQDPGRFIELHVEPRDAFLENLHLVFTGDEIPVDRVDPHKIAKLLLVPVRYRHPLVLVPLVFNRHDVVFRLKICSEPIPGPHWQRQEVKRKPARLASYRYPPV
jgi:hypothetical protein